MEIPRRRGGTYEPRPAVGNILAPTSGPLGSGDVRATPSTRGTAAAGPSRPPWATESDASETPRAPARSPPSSRQHAASHVAPAAASDFTFPGPVSVAGPTAGHPHSPGAALRQPQPHGGSSSSWDDARAPYPGRPQSAGRPQSGGRIAPADQLDLWTQQQQQHHHHNPHYQQHPQHHQQVGSQLQESGRRAEGLYAHVEHMEAVTLQSGAPASAPSGRRAAAAATTTTAAPSRSAAGGGASSGPAARLPGGELSSADARAASGSGAASAVSGRGGGVGAAGRAARVGAASPARSPAPGAAPGGDCAAGRAAAAANGRSTSTPKPRPALPPKRSSSITDNVRRDWVDAGVPERKAGGARGVSAGAGGAGGGERWDADPDGADRGSWLFASNDKPQPQPQPQLKTPGAGSATMVSPAAMAAQKRVGLELRDRRSHEGEGSPVVSDRRRVPDLADRPTSSGWGVDDCDGVSAAASTGSATRRVRPQSPAAAGAGAFGAGASPGVDSTGLEATLSLAPGAAYGSGGGGGGDLTLGHGVMAATGGREAGSAGARQHAAGAKSTEASRQLQALQEENAQLRDQVEHLQRLLATSPAAAAAAGAGGSGIGSTRRGAAARPSSAASTSAAGDVAPTLAVAAAAGVTLQQYKAQVIQLQRQVVLMSQEIESKSRLCFEAEGVLLEVGARLGDLASSSGSNAGGGGADPTAAVSPGDGGGEALSRERLLQVHKWSKQMLSRLRSEKSQSSKLFTQQAMDSRSGGGGMGAASWGAASGGGAGGAGAGPAWAVPFIAAGGNRFLTAAAAAADDLAGAAGGGGGVGCGPSVASIACGQAVLLADPLLAHRLEMQLAAVAPRLAALAVLLKAQLLPAMPWLGLEAADRLQAEVGEAAEGVAQCVDGLVALCSLLPAGATVFGEGPVAQEPKRRAAEVEAGRDSWLYGSPELLEPAEPPSPAVNDDGVISVPRLQAAIAPLLRDRKAGSKALTDILEPVRAKVQAAAAKRSVLEAELRFAARASAVHAEHVSHLMLSVGMALEECRGSKDAAAIKAYFSAAAAVKQVLEAADALDLHPCESCLKALVDVIRVHRGTLDRLPDLLVNAPAADVEGRLLSKVEELHQGFRRAISRLEAHKRRHLDVRAGTAHVDAGADDDLGDEDGSEVLAEGMTVMMQATKAGSDARRTGSAGAGGSASRPQGAAAAGAGTGAPKPGKPPKPRPEWLD